MKKLDLLKKSINGRKIAVIGIGISNRPLIKYLIDNGAKVTAYDRRDINIIGDIAEEMSSLGVSLRLGKDYLENLNEEIIFKTPGMRFDTPELNKARDNGAIITSEMELFFDLCPAQIIGVTGSDGKTTTTTLIHKMLKKQGYRTWLGGNIGNPLLCEIDNIKETDKVVLELSSFQLHTMKQSPDIAVITNISPNHLDMHKDYHEYIDAKKNIMRYQNERSKLIVNFDNEITRKIGEEASGECIYFSRYSDTQITIRDNFICAFGKPILDIRDIKILGMYNVENYMAAIAAVHDIVCANDVQDIAKEFGGVEHRNEFVREIDGIKFYNSSIDSSPNRTSNTLSVFKDKVILICGGKEKGIEYIDLGHVIADKVKVLILIGASSEKIENALKQEIINTGNGKHIKVIKVSTYYEAVKTSYSVAKSGDCVVLSPASTSFDMFDNFEQRGNLFKKLVCEL